MERVVDRAELDSQHSTPPASPGLADIENITQFHFVRHDAGGHVQGDLLDNDKKEDDELDFCLFAPAAAVADGEPANNTVAKIRINTPPPANAEPGFVVAQRDLSYYFPEPASSPEKQNYEAAAMSGQDVLALSQMPWPGSAYPWKVLSIPADQHHHSSAASLGALRSRLLLAKPKKKSRPSKKARMKVRTRLTAARTKMEQSRRAAEEREAAEREKRTRRNREKKVKKKQREKAKKVGAGAEADIDADALDNTSDPD